MTGFSNLVFQSSVHIPAVANLLKPKANSILILFSDKYFAINTTSQLVDNRIFRVAPSGNNFQIFLSCEGTTNETLLDFWSTGRDKFVYGIPFKKVEETCLQFLKAKTFRGGITGIIPYNIRQKGFPGAYADVYRLLSEKFQFPLELKREKGFGRYNSTTGKWDNGLLGKVSNLELYV